MNRTPSNLFNHEKLLSIGSRSYGSSWCFGAECSSNYTSYHLYGPGLGRPSLTPAIAEEEGKKVLQVQAVDLLVSYNAKAHHTFDFDICKAKTGAKLVVRRGQPFTIAITFSKKYDEKVDDLRLVFEAGKLPLPSKGTSVAIILSHEDKKNEWGAKIESQQDNTLMVTVFTPPTLYVGQWNLKMDVVKKEDTKVTIHRYIHNDLIYILFNPWCKDDDVYMEGVAQLSEYLLNQTGGMFAGTVFTPAYIPWHYGQFESCVLDVAMYLLDKSGLNWNTRGKPIRIIRTLSALINSNDDDGILYGGWDGKYLDGHPPQEWTGSVRILEKYWEGKKPIKYGQCWVFSGLCTTLSRALGIPARSVIGFEIAHDSDSSLTVDYYKIDDSWKPSDSVWNFHAWNEAWMARPDLPAGYGGWQVFDATPQETSDGIYCCGPTSVRAIREGKIDLPYDGAFVFSCINADALFWIRDSVGRWEVAEIEKSLVGFFISTKTIGSHGREDLTDQYKPKEGSFMESISVSTAYNTAGKRDVRKQNPNAVKDIEFSVCEAKENKLGEDFELLFKVKNTGDKIRTINGHIEIFTIFYTGVLADKVTTDIFSQVVIQPKEEKNKRIVAPYISYIDKLKDFGLLDVSMWAIVEETEQHFIKKADYGLIRPQLRIKAPSKTKAMEEMNIDVSFDNPLSLALTKCFLIVDGVSTAKKIFQADVQPKGTYTSTVSITANKSGKSELIVNFNSKELKDIKATCAIEII